MILGGFCWSSGSMKEEAKGGMGGMPARRQE